MILLWLRVISNYISRCAVYHSYIISEMKHSLAANAVTPALRAVPVPDRALIPKSQRSQTHLLHRMIVSRAKARITAQKQSLELNMSLFANGTRILTYTASGDPGVPGRSLRDSLRIARATAIVARNSRRKGK